MKYLPFDKIKTRIESSKDESDLAYFYDLLLYGEFLTKTISLFLTSAINEDVERSKYRQIHNLARANAVGDFSKSIEDIVIGPTAQILSSNIRDFELKELSKRAIKGDWQYEAQVLLVECFKDFNIENEPLATKSSLKRWFNLFTHLRNKTKGHGAPRIEACSKACPKLEKSINLIVENYSAFNRPWVHLHRNLNGKFRISKITENTNEFDYLKSENFHNLTDGVYVFLDRPRKVELFYSNAELTDFWITNGNFKKEYFETISYITDERITKCGKNFIQPVISLPSSHTEGESSLEIKNNCYTNIPSAPDFYVKRLELESELEKVLLQEDRYPIITLLGKGGVGKTSLGLDLITKITETERFEIIIWFSARDIDLLIDGPKQVQTKVINIEDIAKEYCSLMEEKTKTPIQYFSDEMTKNSFGKALYVFDNFETVSNPIEVFEWINTFIRNPNKVLITSRISRNFKADYPIEVLGMTEKECIELIDKTSKSLKIEHLITPKYKSDLITESDGHPYIIKILLGQVAKKGEISKIERIVAEQEKILTALFKRTFNTLSPASKRVFLTLCSWNSMIPMIAVEAVLWRPENEKMEVQKAIEELRQSSFIEVIGEDENGIINVPLAATLFGKTELEVYPDKIKILADRKLLMEFGATSYNNISSGLVRNIERKFKAISRRINSIEEFNKELPILEYIASKYPKTYTYIIQIYEEYDKYNEVKYYVREYIKHTTITSDKERLWTKLADICKHTNDWNGEINALTELIQLPNSNLQVISDTANRINNLIYNDRDAKIDDYRGEVLDIIIKVFKTKINKCDATDLSRLGWLYLNNNQPEEAIKVVKKGLEQNSENIYCNKLKENLENNDKLT